MASRYNMSKLAAMYRDENLTMEEIARRLGCSYHLVWYHMYGILRALNFNAVLQAHINEYATKILRITISSAADVHRFIAHFRSVAKSL